MTDIILLFYLFLVPGWQISQASAPVILRLEKTTLEDVRETSNNKGRKHKLGDHSAATLGGLFAIEHSLVWLPQAFFIPIIPKLSPKAIDKLNQVGALPLDECFLRKVEWHKQELR